MVQTVTAAVLAAPFAGSLAGVLILRLPLGAPVVLARSVCDRCGHRLGPLELVPLISFAVLGGRCRACRAPIARFHVAVELAAIAVPVSCVAVGIAAPGPLWVGCSLGWMLLALGWTDARSLVLPDVLTLPLLLGGLAEAALLERDVLASRAAASILGYASLRGVAWLYRRVRHRDGLGGGDAKLFAAAGAWTGLAGLSPVLLTAALLGLAGAGLLRLAGRPMTATTRLPFGAALALATWVVFLIEAT